MASKKLNLDAVLLSKPRKRPAEIVTPDLDVPGISANTCDRPMIKASKEEISSKSFFAEGFNVAKNKTRPNIMAVSYTHLTLPTIYSV